MADNVTTEELEQALSDLASEMGLSVKEYVESLGYATVADLQASNEGLQAQITAITELDADNGAESLAEKIKAIHDVVSNEDGVVQEILNKILENKQAILDEVSRATAAEAELGQSIADLKAYADSKVLQASSMDICGIANKFRQGLGLADADCTAADGDGATL